MLLLSRRLPVGSLIELCRSLRYSLASGLMLRDAMELQATKGPRPLRPVAAGIVKQLNAGWGLQEALDKQRDSFPPLFVALTAVGEEAGSLPEVLTELEKYYVTQRKLRRDFLSEITWPVFQLVVAVLVIAGLIYILGIIALSRGPTAPRLDPLGLGLLGPEGAVKFLALVFGTAAAALAVFWALKRLLRRRAVVERILLRVPVLGPCLQALALTRFSVALHLMLETNLSVLKTVRLAMLATDNAAYIAAAPAVEASIRRGNGIAASLAQARVFPDQFLGAVGVAEEGGRLTEVLRHQAEEYDELARRRLGFLNRIASYLVWIAVAGVLILAIYRIFTAAYLENIKKALPEEREMGAPAAPGAGP